MLRCDTSVEERRKARSGTPFPPLDRYPPPTPRRPQPDVTPPPPLATAGRQPASQPKGVTLRQQVVPFTESMQSASAESS